MIGVGRTQLRRRLRGRPVTPIRVLGAIAFSYVKRWRMTAPARWRARSYRRGRTMLTRRTQIGAILAALGAATVAATVSAAAPGAAQTAPLGGANPVAVLTGAQSINSTETRYQVKGTDLGIMWTDERGQILAAFGDTFGLGWAGISSGFANPGTIDWRSNTLARSTDRNPSNGMSFNDYVTAPITARFREQGTRAAIGRRTKIPDYSAGKAAARRTRLAALAARGEA